MAIWDWRGATATGSADPAAALRRTGLIQALVGAAVAALLWAFDRPLLAAIVGSIAAFTLVAALASPTGLYAAIHRGLAVLGGWIGRFLTVVLLTPLFFGFFAVFGGLFRRGSRDKLDRRLDPDAPTYWRQRDDGEPSRDRYERHF